MSLRSIAGNISTKVHNLADDVRDASSTNKKDNSGEKISQEGNHFRNRSGQVKRERGFGAHPSGGSIANRGDRSRGQKLTDLMSGSANITSKFAKSIVKSSANKTQAAATKTREVATKILNTAEKIPGKTPEFAANIRDASSRATTVGVLKSDGETIPYIESNNKEERDNFVSTLEANKEASHDVDFGDKQKGDTFVSTSYNERQTFGKHVSDLAGNRVTSRTSFADKFVDTVSGAKNIAKSFVNSKIEAAYYTVKDEPVISYDGEPGIPRREWHRDHAMVNL